MNAVIGLCNFCETHGPRPIFCTQTIRDSRIDELNFDAVNEKCPGCDSIGNETGMLSEDNATNCRFLSTQSPVIADVIPLIKQAAVRSLSCEVQLLSIVAWIVQLNVKIVYCRSTIRIATEISCSSAMHHVVMFSATHSMSMTRRLVDSFACSP